MLLTTDNDPLLVVMSDNIPVIEFDILIETWVYS